MIKPKHKPTFRFLLFAILTTVGLFYYSCRKDIKSTEQNGTNAFIAQAKTWYESTYATNNNNTPSFNGQHTAFLGRHLLLSTTFSLNQLVKPDWNNAANHK